MKPAPIKSNNMMIWHIGKNLFPQSEPTERRQKKNALIDVCVGILFWAGFIALVICVLHLH
jgi:hypothetical protein